MTNLYVTESPPSLPSEPSNSEREELNLIEQLHREGIQAQSQRGSSGSTLWEVWERNGQLYAGDHWDQGRSIGPHTEGDRAHHPGVHRAGSMSSITRFTINRTQQAVIAQRAIAFERPEQFRFEPVETLDEPVLFIRPEVGQSILQAAESGEIDLEGMGLAGFTPEQLQGEAPIPDRLAQVLMAGGILNDESVVRVNDDTIARAVQKVWDTLYRRSGAPNTIATNELYSSIFGHQPLLLQWDVDNHTFRFTNPHILNVVIDPTAEDVRDAEYVILTTMISADRAKVLWPELRDEIEKAAESGTLDPRSSDSYHTGRTHPVHFSRKMVVVRVAWVRYQDVPMGLDNAVAQGRVVLAEPKEEADERGEFTELVDVAGFQLEGNGQVTVEREDGSVTPARLVKPDTGGTTAPGRQNWPQEPGILQVHSLPQIDRVAQSLRCPYADIPVGWNKNIPVPYSPYGQGEPERLEDLQQAINRLFTILHRHARYYQAPMEFWPEDLYNDVMEQGFSPYSQPGRIIPVRQDIYQLMAQLGGRSGFGVVNQIPPIPSFYVQLLTILLQEFDRLSGFTDVLQGAMPDPDTSGRAIEALQSAARGPIGVKTRQTEWMLEYVGEIGLDAIRKWLPESIWASILNQYPLPVLRFIRSQIDQTDFNVEVVLVSGRGANQTVDFERASTLYMEGSPARLIDRRRAMELADVTDIDGTIRRIEQENREGFAGLSPQSQGGGPDQGNPDSESE